MTKKHKDTTAAEEQGLEDNKWEKFAKEQEQMEDSPVELDIEAEEQELEQVDLQGVDATKLQNKIEALELKLAEFKDQTIRTQAEMDNLRRRTEREIGNAHKYGSEKLLSDLLPVIDSLVRGLEGQIDEANPQIKAMRDGMRMTLDLLEKTLEKHGVIKIAPEKGEAFNPERHEAMSMVPTPDAESNTVVQVLQAGYELNGRVVRAAMIIVAQ